VYRGAIDAIYAGIDPYLNRTIGVAFLYPPPFLLIAKVLTSLPVNTQEAVFTAINLLILAWIAWVLGQAFDQRKKTSIFLLFLFLFAGPLLELLIVGQINLLSLGGILMVFLFDEKKPWLAGLGLCLGAITKVTP
jgi:multidrug transporter EmrE-like cation transporter